MIPVKNREDENKRKERREGGGRGGRGERKRKGRKYMVHNRGSNDQVMYW